MIKDLDLTLESLLSGEAVPGSELAAARISFSAPDDEWSRHGNSLELNVYLYDVRENRELRSNEEYRERNPDGTITRKKAPPRLNCAFLITAWNKATQYSLEEKILQEHRLLSQVLEVLLKNPTVPKDYLRGSLMGQQPDLPIVTAQKGGLPDPVEFWSSLGSPLRPSVNCVITISLDLKQWVTGPMAMTQVTEYRRPGEDKIDRIVRIGGRVHGTGVPGPGIDGAVVALDTYKKTARTDSMGYYMMSNIPAGTYMFEASATGYVTRQVNLTLPAPAGENYDIILLRICKVAGRILDDWDPTKGVGNATVTVVELQLDAVADATGNYVFENITEGSYTFAVRVTGYVDKNVTVDVPHADGGNYNIRISQPYDIAGRVVNRRRPWQGYPGATVAIRELGLTAATDSNGYYNFTGIPRGTYTFDVNVGAGPYPFTKEVPAPAGENYDIWY